MTKLCKSSLSIIDVGHGSSTVVSTAEHVVVIDTGPGSALLEYLSQCGITEIDAVILSHADQDHMGALAQLVSSKLAVVRRVYLNTDSEKSTAAWDDMLYEISNLGNEGKIELTCCLTPNQSKDLVFGKLECEVLAPSTYLAAKGPGSTVRDGRKITSNTISAVICLRYDGAAVALLSGDIDLIGLDILLSGQPTLKAPILLFPHHGGRPGIGNLREFAKKLLNSVSPDLIVFSIGRSRENFPHQDVINAIRELAPGCRIACTQLSIACAPKVPSTKPSHLVEFFSQGMYENKCCAGTIAIELSSGLSIRPTAAEHERFITANAPSALCRR